MICDKLDIDVWELITLADCHLCVKILQPGACLGGHCIAVDPWFIVATTPEQARIIRTAREVNDHKSGSTMTNIKVACLGLAFKPDIDDLRESPAVAITQNVTQLGCHVLVVEPNIHALPQKLTKPSLVLNTLSDALAIADVVCVLVKHKVFIEALQKIHGHGRAIDAVGIFA